MNSVFRCGQYEAEETPKNIDNEETWERGKETTSDWKNCLQVYVKSDIFSNSLRKQECLILKLRC